MIKSKNPYIKISDLLSKYKYYNIAMLLMAFNGNFDPLLEAYGEKEAFLLYRRTSEYCQFMINRKSVDHYPVIVTQDLNIVNEHYTVAAIIHAGYKDISYFVYNDATPDYGDQWIKQFKCCKEVKLYYKNIAKIYDL